MMLLLHMKAFTLKSHVCRIASPYFFSQSKDHCSLWVLSLLPSSKLTFDIIVSQPLSVTLSQMLNHCRLLLGLYLTAKTPLMALLTCRAQIQCSETRSGHGGKTSKDHKVESDQKPMWAGSQQERAAARVAHGRSTEYKDIKIPLSSNWLITKLANTWQCKKITRICKSRFIIIIIVIISGMAKWSHNNRLD